MVMHWNLVFTAVLITVLCLFIYTLGAVGEEDPHFINIIKRLYFGFTKAKVKRLLGELKRKSFHLIGLLVPALYYTGIKNNTFTKETAVTIIGSLAGVMLVLDFARTTCPQLGEFAFRTLKIIRQKEKHKLSGSTWFLLSGFLTFLIFDDFIAITAFCFLVMGDTAAAIVGISFGQTKVYKGKSLEGTLAMFFVCCFIAMVTFNEILLFEYIGFVGACAACLTELLMKGIDDNLTIPIVSSIAMTIAKIRLKPLYDTNAFMIIPNKI